MKRKGLLHLLCATMLLAITIVYLPSCSNDEEDAEYWTVTLEDHYAPYAPNDKWGDWSLGPKSVFGSRDNGETMVKVCFSVKMRLKVSPMKKVMSMYYVLKRLQRFNK